jgi:hypothetical protein
MFGPRSAAEAPCTLAYAETVREPGSNQPPVNRDCADEWEISNLAMKDFHVFEDGVEQPIRSVTVQQPGKNLWNRDNFGYHEEYSRTARGIWSLPDMVRQRGLPFKFSFYRLAYVPPKSEEGKCHQIKVTVNRHNTVVWYRNQYCYNQRYASDPLIGTQLEKQLETYVASKRLGKIALFANTGFFYTDKGVARVDLALEIPGAHLKVDQTSGDSYDTQYTRAGILGMVDAKNGTQALRFSDLFEITSFSTPNISGPIAFADSSIPTRYEKQLDLPPGEYDLYLVLGDGAKFGLFETPLIIDPYDGKQLALSSVVLCKRFHDASVPEEEATNSNLAPRYVPLVSKGVQFTPAGDTSFRKGEPLFAYFEVYEPLLVGSTAATVQTQLRITDTKTGQVKVDTGPRSAADWVQPGKSTIAIAEQIAVDKLPAGSYNLEVLASDSAGRGTAWRAATFTVE